MQSVVGVVISASDRNGGDARELRADSKSNLGQTLVLALKLVQIEGTTGRSKAVGLSRDLLSRAGRGISDASWGGSQKLKGM